MEQDEGGNAGGLSAWIWLGTAIRLAHQLKMRTIDHYSSSRSIWSKVGTASHQAQVVETEVKRRTMFSCFILDRMLTFGYDQRSVIYGTVLWYN